MAGTAVHTNEAERPRPDPTLALPPVGLSARRAERWLDLPPGAWQKRRLYALKVGTESYDPLGVRRGDFVIVEPGARERPGQLVVTKTQAALSLRRIPLANPRVEMPTALELPFGSSRSKYACRVVGTVLAILRPTGTGALKPVRLGTRNPPRRSGSLAQRARPQAPDTASNDLRAARLRRLLETSEPVTSFGAGQSRPRDDIRERWRSRLATLLVCQAHAHDPGVRSALLDEAANAARRVLPPRGASDWLKVC